jgi:hypothetical protein
MSTPVPDRRQPTMNTCPPRRSARKSAQRADLGLRGGQRHRPYADSVTCALARRPVPSRGRGTVALVMTTVPRLPAEGLAMPVVIENRCNTIGLDTMRCVKVVVPQPPPPSKISDPPTPQRLDERHEFFSPRMKFSRASKLIAPQRFSGVVVWWNTLLHNAFRVSEPTAKTPVSGRCLGQSANYLRAS